MAGAAILPGPAGFVQKTASPKQIQFIAAIKRKGGIEIFPGLRHLAQQLMAGGTHEMQIDAVHIRFAIDQRDGLIQRVNGFGILSGLEIKQPTPGFNAPFPKGQIIAAGLDQDR